MGGAEQPEGGLGSEWRFAVGLAEGSEGFVGRGPRYTLTFGKLSQLFLDKPCHYYSIPFERNSCIFAELVEKILGYESERACPLQA